jgi:WhiB family redox-sensing transcriptional regulator
MTSPRRGLASSHGVSTGDGDWWTRAACRNADPEAFAPPPDEYGAMTATEAAYALTYCARCPVAAECLNDALAKGDDYGIRGGIDMAARNKQRRAPHAAKAPAATTAPAKVEPAKERRKPWPSDEAAARRAADRARAIRRRQEGTEPPCGTRAGYDHHRAIGEDYCDPCRNYRRNESQAERDRQVQSDDLTPRARLGAERAARAAEARAQLAAQIEDLVQVGADLHRAAHATSKTVGALEKALQRAQRHDLIAKLKRAA